MVKIVFYSSSFVFIVHDFASTNVREQAVIQHTLNDFLILKRVVPALESERVGSFIGTVLYFLNLLKQNLIKKMNHRYFGASPSSPTPNSITTIGSVVSSSPTLNSNSGGQMESA